MDLAEVERIAALARLDLAPGEAERMAGNLQAILGYVELLQALDTSGVEPTVHAIPVATPLRDDRATPPPRSRAGTRQRPRAHRHRVRRPQGPRRGREVVAPGDRFETATALRERLDAGSVSSVELFGRVAATSFSRGAVARLDLAPHVREPALCSGQEQGLRRYPCHPGL